MSTPSLRFTEEIVSVLKLSAPRGPMGPEGPEGPAGTDGFVVSLDPPADTSVVWIKPAE